MQNLLASAGAPRFVSFVGWIFLLPLAAVDASAIAPVHANIHRLRLFRLFFGVFLGRSRLDLFSVICRAPGARRPRGIIHLVPSHSSFLYVLIMGSL